MSMISRSRFSREHRDCQVHGTCHAGRYVRHGDHAVLVSPEVRRLTGDRAIIDMGKPVKLSQSGDLQFGLR